MTWKRKKTRTKRVTLALLPATKKSSCFKNSGWWVFLKKKDGEYSIADAESIVAKAIRDGAIEASLDHANGWMVSKEAGDIYSTNELQAAFNSRIAFCLNMHNEAVRALRRKKVLKGGEATTGARACQSYCRGRRRR
ncbi:hypothetical protein PS1_016260 [Malus domestica]